MGDLDAKDCIILDTLQKNCRTSLTELAKQVNLSIDSVKKRIKKMENINFYPKIEIKPRSLGFAHIVDIKIKFNNHSKKEIDKLINHLKENPRVAEIFSISGEWNLSIVVIAKDADDLANITSEIKDKFGQIIASWTESVTLKAYKFETYDIKKLLNYD